MRIDNFYPCGRSVLAGLKVLDDSAPDLAQTTNFEFAYDRLAIAPIPTHLPQHHPTPPLILYSSYASKVSADCIDSTCISYRFDLLKVFSRALPSLQPLAVITTISDFRMNS